MRRIWAWFRTFCAVIALAAAPSAYAAPPAPATSAAAPGQIRVAVRVLPPFVIEQNGVYTGFSIELWNAIAQRLNMQTQFVRTADVHAQLDAVAGNQADVGVGAISITAAREQQFDFSEPILNGGLQILTKAEPQRPEATALQTLLHLLFGPAILVWLGIAVLLTIVPAHIVWFLERNQEGSMIGSKSYFPGIFQAFFWGLGALATQADSMPRHWFARIVAVLWMFTSVVFVAFYTAQLTASLTTQAIAGAISGPNDLPGKRVGAIQPSTAADYLRAEGIGFTPFATPDAAYHAVADGSIDAVVYDGPVLQYYASHDPASSTHVVGLLFHNEDYGFAFRNDSNLRRRVDTELLALRENGEYQRLVTKWFGSQ